MHEGNNNKNMPWEVTLQLFPRSLSRKKPKFNVMKLKILSQDFPK